MNSHSLRRRTGILLAAATAVISGFAVFINGYGVRAWAEVSDSATYTTLKNTVAALILVAGGLIVSRRAGSGPILSRETLRRRWPGLIAVAVIGGSVPFLLFFEGLARASSGDAAFIHKTLVVWVGLLAVTILKEKIGPLHVLAIGALVLGQAAIAGVEGMAFGSGEWMILGATLLWSVETLIAKRVLAEVSPLGVGIARMAGGGVVLIVYVLLFGDLSGLSTATTTHFGWIVMTGVTLAAYVATWFAALARAQALDVTAVLVGGALITALLETGIRGVALPPVSGLALVLLGVVLAVMSGWLRPSLAE